MAVCDIVIGVIGTVELSSKTGTGLIVVSVVWVIAYAMSVAPIGKSHRCRPSLNPARRLLMHSPISRFRLRCYRREFDAHAAGQDSRHRCRPPVSQRCGLREYLDVIVADMQIGFTAELLMLASYRTILSQSCFPSNRRIGVPRQVSRVTLR